MSVNSHEAGAAPIVATLDRARFQTTVAGKSTDLVTLRNRAGMAVSICNYGGRVMQILVPDAQGRLGDVALGYGDLAGCVADTCWMGAFIGRFANRIAHARFTLDGREHPLTMNNAGKHHLHGGPGGCGTQVMEALAVTEDTLTLHHVFKDGDDGYPGTLSLTLIYHVDADNGLCINWTARASGAATIASFTHHAYFNLSADSSRTVHDHHVQIEADQVLQSDEELIPTGQLADVAGTPLDFRVLRPLADSIGSADAAMVRALGHDHHYVRRGAIGGGGYDSSNQGSGIDGGDIDVSDINGGDLHRDATAFHPASGRTLAVWSTEPGLQFYAGNVLDRLPASARDKHGRPFIKHGALCFEPSRRPDAPNHPHFPSTVMQPGQVRIGRIVYRFGVRV